MKRIDGVKRPTVPELIPMVRKYYQKDGNSVGGNLHLVLEDKNVGDGNILFCINEAQKTGDVDGEQIAHLLLRMTKTQRLKLAGTFWREKE